MNDPALSTCDCCEGPSGPEPVRNDPGLAALRYRADEQPGFYARMLQSLPLALADPSAPGSPRPLGRLLARSGDDPAVALLDAFACVADVLTFYTERIANEGFLRTATERGSVLELAREIGYELKPGVAASVHLAFIVEDAPGAPGVCAIAQGSPVQSVPPQGKLPQVFETSAELVAHAAWNALLPHQVRPADMAVLGPDDIGTAPLMSPGPSGRHTLALLGPAGSFLAGSVHKGLQSSTLFRLDPSLPVDDIVDAIEVGRIYIADSITGIVGGDLLLFIGKRGQAVSKLVLRAVGVVAEPALKRLRIDVEPLPDPVVPQPPPSLVFSVPYAIKPVLSYARPTISTLGFTSSVLTATVSNQVWRERDLQAMIGIQRWSPADLVKSSATPPKAPAVAVTGGAFAFSAKLGFFGNNAPRWKSLPSNAHGNLHDEAYARGWDEGDTNVNGPALPRTIWQDSQGNQNLPHVYLDRPVPNVSRAGWVVFDAPEAAAQAFGVFDARETARADYGISGRAMALTLAGDDGEVLPKQSTDFHFRSTTAYVASRDLALVDLPIDAPIDAGETAIELDRMVLGLAVGQPVALTGERDDLPGVDAAEIAVLRDVVHADKRSTLVFEQGITYAYKRAGLRISANVVHATHGASVSEMLGSGNGSLAHQTFRLKKPPTSFISAKTASGVQSTLEVRVNGVRWDEVSSLYGAEPDQQVFTTRISDDASMDVTFGDGVQGARLPTGSVNVTARYRSGIGPDGEVAAATLTMLQAMPLGLRGVTNPIAASGAEGPEHLADARRNAPRTLLTFDRVVSLLDYENYAGAYPGVGKARGDVLSINRAATVFVTIAGATGGPPGADVLVNLPASIAGASDPSQRFVVAAYAQRYFSCTAQIAVDPRYLFADVQAAVSSALLQAFGFASRDLGQSVTAAEVVTVIHGVPGIVAADLIELQPYANGPPPTVAALDAVGAFGARWDDKMGTAAPAELLLINPAALSVVEMQS